MFMSRNRALDSGKKIVMRSSTDEIDTIDTLQRGVLYLGIYFSSTEDGVIVEVKIEWYENVIISGIKRYMSL